MEQHWKCLPEYEASPKVSAHGSMWWSDYVVSNGQRPAETTPNLQGAWLVWFTWSCWELQEISSISFQAFQQPWQCLELRLWPFIFIATNLLKKSVFLYYGSSDLAIFPISSSNSRRAGLAMDVVLEEIHGRQHVVHEALMHPHFMDWLRQLGQ